MQGPGNPFWGGGRHVTHQGYVKVYVPPGEPIGDAMVSEMSMFKKQGLRSLLEHRLVMALHLGRPLLRGEVVHHVNGVRDDNRIENLRLVSSRSEHVRALHLEACPHCGKPLRS